MRALVGEPLLHFVVAGALLFAGYGWLHRDDADTAGRPAVRIGEDDVRWLAETWARQWRTEPSDAQLRGLVADYLREELLVREARALGLDRDDVIVRRRLAQKMTFLLEDTARTAEPGDDELRRLYDRDPARFRAAERVSFEHVYFEPGERGARAATEALAQLSDPGAGVDPAVLGDRSLLPRRLDGVDERAIAGQLGPEFARALFRAGTDVWHGPIPSTYGLHLVRVRRAEGARQRAFAEVRAELVDDWRRSMQQTAERRYFEALLAKYDVAVDADVRALVGPLALARAGAE